MRVFNKTIIFLLSFCLFALNLKAEESKKEYILIKNVKIFDGKSSKLSPSKDVLIENNLIKKIGKNLQVKNAKVLDGLGYTLLPGLIESHAHLSITNGLSYMKHNSTWEDIAIRTSKMAEVFLMDGFTTVRDVGGVVMGTKRAIDSGLIPGPRIYPSGAFLSQTSGHGDLRDTSSRHYSLSGYKDEYLQRLGFYHIVDGKPQVLAATREVLKSGATQIKIMAGGGNGSEFDPIDSIQFLPSEMKAIVDAAKDWDTYVAAHLFDENQMNRAIDAGVKSFEHAFIMNEKIMKKIVKKGIYISAQMNGLSKELRDSPFNPPYAKAGIIDVQNQAKDFVRLVKKYKPKMVFATDALGDFDTQTKQRRFELYERARVFGNFETLKSATSTAGQLAQLTNKRNPYKQGKLGVVEEGAYADLLIVKGNPLKDIKILGAHDKWIKAPKPKEIETLKLIMKDGQIYKNKLKFKE